MPTAMILLVGEQPAPNLLPTRYLQPDAAILVYTTRTQRVAENLEALLEPACSCHLCQVDPYQIHQAQEALDTLLADAVPGHNLVFNLTGGTKPMALAAFQVARTHSSPFVYFQTEGNRSILYSYTFDEEKITAQEPRELPETISLDDYLRMYIRRYTSGEPRHDFEQLVVNTLRNTSGIAEVMSSLSPQGVGALEVDFAVRCGNQIGIGEIKTQAKKAAIDQLNAVAEQRYLGTYVRKFLISGTSLDFNNKILAERYRIHVIELPSYGKTGTLSPEDRRLLAEAILRGLGGLR